ncbi:MAG: hypothetical protein OES47_00915 [Acidobacteriota bacterium]|nr:hypothetical protein [Acidobacteriota bacterium]
MRISHNVPRVTARRLAILLLLVVTTGSATALLAADLQSDYALESRLLENELERYVETRERESQAIEEVRRASSQLDGVLADPNSPVGHMRELEATFAAARETAYLRLKETAEARRRMYDRMERLAEIARGLEARPPEPVAAAESGPEGLWKFRFHGIEVYALSDLGFQIGGLDGGWTVNGPYRTSNGHRGTLRGFFRGNRLDLEAIDSRRGKVAVLSGSVDGSGRLEGTWQAVETEMHTDRPKGGVWTAHRVSSESEVVLD